MTLDGSTTLTVLAILAAFALLGGVFGVAYFAALRVNARLYVAGSGWLRPLILHAVRITGAILVFAFAVHFGAATLLATLAGFLIARLFMVRPERQQS